MHEADATSTGLEGWVGDVAVALVIWAVFTVVVIAAAPAVVDLPLPLTAVVVAIACIGLGLVGGRAIARRRPRPAAGARLGIAVVVVGQLLDVVLVAAAGGQYPRAGSGGTASVLTLLLGGYACTLLGAVLADHLPRQVAHDPAAASTG